MNTYILVADAGSTKSTWCLVTPEGKQNLIHTDGINPITKDETVIKGIVCDQLLPHLKNIIGNSTAKVCIHYYGAGCIPTVCDKMNQTLTSIIPHSTANVRSDLLGAARAVCGNCPGIACILGTGSNSCYYDGTDIAGHISPLGYILGDEGSGAYLGKRLVSDIFKGLLSEELRDKFVSKYDLTEAVLIQKVYREPGANFFLASLTPFLTEHRHDKEIHALITSCFDDFFTRNINSYGHKELPVNFVGSIAWHFRPEIEEVAERNGYKVGQIIQSPITFMADYHIKMSSKSE